MKKVYVVMSGCTGDEHIVCIKSSKKKADEMVKQMNDEALSKYQLGWMEEWEVS